MKNVLMVFMAVPFFVAYSDPSLEQGEVIRRYTNAAIGEVTEIKMQNGGMAAVFSEATIPSNQVSKEHMQELKKWRLFEQKLPYRGNFYLSMGTLGQQAKLCDWAVIGRISHLARGSKDTKEYPITLTLDVETNLFGELPSNRVTVNLMKWYFAAGDKDLAVKVRQEYHAGDRFLVFLARGRTSVSPDMGSFSFNKPAHNKKFGDQPTLLYGSRGLIRLNDANDEREILSAANGYLTCLRKEKRDVEKYYQLLRRLENFTVERIRDDAKTDLVHLLSVPSIAEKVANEKNMDDDVKNCAQHILIFNSKKKISIGK